MLGLALGLESALETTAVIMFALIPGGFAIVYATTFDDELAWEWYA